jgi:TRAP-type mannitol/chloroaromatic compound transport system substrate-binding protein
MRRRHFVHKALTTAAGAAALGAALGCRDEKGPGATAGAVQGPKVRWRLASSFPRGLDTIFAASDVLARRVEALTGGAFTIKVHAAGEIVPGLEVLDAAQQGSVDVAHTASYYFTGKNPALAFDTCVPFGLSARQHLAWLNEGGGLDLIRSVYSDFNVVNFPGGNTGAQMGGWFKREIGGASDLTGLKMRIPGLGGQVMSRLGATVQVLAGGDIFPALERGAIDATEWVGPYDDEKLGFHKIAKFYYYPGWWEPGPALTFLVNKRAWEKLPKLYQEVFETASSEAGLTMQTRYDQKNPAALERLLAAGVKLRPFGEEILTAAHRVSEELLREQAAKDAAYRKLFEHWDKARQGMFAWFGTAERAYADFMFKPPHD